MAHTSQPRTGCMDSDLSNRKQVTKAGHSNSEALPLRCGVTQGSILGPLLFSIYINDLPTRLLNHKFNLFADDTAITVKVGSSSELESSMNNAL